MLFRSIEQTIYQRLSSDSDKVLVVNGARQVGKSYIIRHVGQQIYANFVEVNLIEDFAGDKLFASVKTVDDFYLALSSIAGDKLGNEKDTLVFLDEIQQYPHLLTLLKFLREDGRFRYVASGSLLGVTLRQSNSIPMGSIEIIKMYPLDFGEFLIANGFGTEAIDNVKGYFERRESLPEALHTRILGLFRRYLLVGGMPEAVNEYLSSHNIVRVRQVQNDIHTLYGLDAAKYDSENTLKIKRIYEMIPSNMENTKKRLFFNRIEEDGTSRAKNYLEEIDYLVSSGIVLEVKAKSNPVFPLISSGRKNLLKLYLNDVGLLTSVLYRNNIRPVLEDECGVNLGSVYECVVACELASKNLSLFYYDNKANGEVDFMIDNFDTLSILPIEVKSGKDYKRHIAISRMVSNPDYSVEYGLVLSNSREIEVKEKIVYLPIYMVMFLGATDLTDSDVLF